jgi:hypothetical protein
MSSMPSRGAVSIGRHRRLSKRDSDVTQREATADGHLRRHLALGGRRVGAGRLPASDGPCLLPRLRVVLDAREAAPQFDGRR